MRCYLLVAAALLGAPATAQSVKAGIEAWGRADYGAALAAWRPLAAKGNPDAMFNLGQAYRLGRGVPIDLAAAQNWYERAAHAGHVDAQTELGILLFQAGNRAAALRWLKSAAGKGEARSQLLYGTALYNGDGVARDPLASYRYIAKSAAQGLLPALSTLAQLDAAMPEAMRRQAMAGASALAPASPIKRPGKALSIASTSSPAPPPTVATRNWRVQLGAFSQRTGAEALFHKFATGPLIGRKQFLVPAGAVTRLQAGPFASRTEAV
ncbi:MAG: SPOR domain-containing protein, partial [Pseudomonadota bacterium]|nr:SPOR domain-containing protein [Pseudomonadota bacterium]